MEKTKTAWNEMQRSEIYGGCCMGETDLLARQTSEIMKMSGIEI
ncbi:hypothetical protein [Enterococcus mundtii]